MIRIQIEVPKRLLDETTNVAHEDGYDSDTAVIVAMTHYVQSRRRTLRLPVLSTRVLFGSAMKFKAVHAVKPSDHQKGSAD